MGRPDSVRTAIIDAALANTTVEDGQALAALCDIHVSATRAACQQHGGRECPVGNDLMDADEYIGVGAAL